MASTQASVVHERTERTPLLRSSSTVCDSATSSSSQAQDDKTAFAILPLALLAGLAMAFTAATSVQAYSQLICGKQVPCQDHSQTAQLFAGSIALATALASAVTILLLGPVERLSRRNPSVALLLWFATRAMSPLMLLLGVLSNNLILALSARLFESLASDNILHFNLNAVYVLRADMNTSSTLMGVSLALYVVGISISPFVGGLLKDIRQSFIVALALFGVSIVYTLILVRRFTLKLASPEDGPSSGHQQDARNADPSAESTFDLAMFKTPFSPLAKGPRMLFTGLAMMVYNTGQTYIFEAILIYTTLTLRFNPTENGALLSIASGSGAVYLSVTLLLIPFISARLGLSKPGNETIRKDASSRHFMLAVFSLAIYAAFLTALAYTRNDKYIYDLFPLAACGIAASPFIKSYFASQFPQQDRPGAIGALVVMESIGAFLGPICLGLVQVIWSPGAVLIAVAVIMCASVFFLVVGKHLGMERGKTRDPQASEQ